MKITKPKLLAEIVPCEAGGSLSNVTVASAPPAGAISFERILNTPSLPASMVTSSSFATGGKGSPHCDKQILKFSRVPAATTSRSISVITSDTYTEGKIFSVCQVNSKQAVGSTTSNPIRPILTHSSVKGKPIVFNNSRLYETMVSPLPFKS